MSNTYLELYINLKRAEFNELIGEQKFLDFLNQFEDLHEQKKFLQFVLDQVEISGGVYINPDTIEEGGCFLSQFFNQDEIKNLMLIKIPNKLNELDDLINSIPLPLNFKPTVKQSKLDEIFEELTDEGIICDQKFSFDEMVQLLISENVHDSDTYIRFLVDIKTTTYLLEEHLFPLFSNLNKDTVDESKKFFQNKLNKGKLVLIKEKSIREANSKMNRKNSPEKISEQIKKKIDSIFSL